MSIESTEVLPLLVGGEFVVLEEVLGTELSSPPSSSGGRERRGGVGGRGPCMRRTTFKDRAEWELLGLRDLESLACNASGARATRGKGSKVEGSEITIEGGSREAERLILLREMPLNWAGGDACKGGVMYHACPPTALALGPKEEEVEKCDPVERRRAAAEIFCVCRLYRECAIDEEEEGDEDRDATPILLPVAAEGGALWEKATGEKGKVVPPPVKEDEGEEGRAARPVLLRCAMRRRNPSTLASNRAAAVRCAAGARGKDGEGPAWRALGSLAGPVPPSPRPWGVRDNTGSSWYSGCAATKLTAPSTSERTGL